MSQSESTMLSTSPPKKRFQISMILNQVFKLLLPSNNIKEENPKPKNLPSISVTTPDGQTTIVE